MGVDRSSPMPLYYQLKRIFVEQIENGQLKPGDAVPTENQIQAKYDVSRTTVRKALSELEAEGKISRYRGRGTFIARPRLGHNPERQGSLEDHMQAQGLTAGWKLLSAEWVSPDEMITERLQISSEQMVFCLKRLRLENDDPIGYHLAYASPHFAAAIDTSAYTSGGSLRYLRGTEVLETSYANRILEARPASREEATLLNMSPGSPLLWIERLIYSEQAQPVEYFRGVYRGDRFQYHINHMQAINPINA